MIGSRQNPISYSCIEQLHNDINSITLNQIVIFVTLTTTSLAIQIVKREIRGTTIVKLVILDATRVLEMTNSTASHVTTLVMTFMREELHVRNNEGMAGCLEITNEMTET